MVDSVTIRFRDKNRYQGILYTILFLITEYKIISLYIQLQVEIVLTWRWEEK